MTPPSAASSRRVNGVLSYSLADHLGSAVQQISGGAPGTAILIQPALRFAEPLLNGLLGSSPGLDAAEVGSTRIVTVNGTDSPISGKIMGALNVESGGCGHCMNPDVARFVIFAAGQPLGTSGDQYINAAARVGGVDASDYLPPIAVPFTSPS